MACSGPGQNNVSTASLAGTEEVMMSSSYGDGTEVRDLRRFATLLLFVSLFVPSSFAAAADAGDKALTKKLDAIRRRFALKRAIGIVVANVDTGEVLYSHNPSALFIPASGMKLATMGASLHYLGPNYQFETRFLSDGPIVDGVVAGNLYVHGSGDPSLTRHEMEFIAQSLEKAGLREVRGDVVLDDSFFDDQLRGPASYGDILKEGLPIQSALSYNYNLVELRARPGLAGAQAELHDEGYGYFDVLNRVKTAARGRPWVRVQKLKADRVMVQGRVIQGDEEESIGTFVAPDPTAYFASAFVGKLRERGILVPGQWVRGRVEGKSLETLYVHRSGRLVEVLAALGKYSNNFSAEQMLKTLGAHRFGAPGSFESGSRAVSEYLIGLGFAKEDFRVSDGSGLSYDNYLSAAILVKVVEDLYRAPEMRTEFVCSLALAGVDGTLRHRFLNEDYLGRIMAKTGSLAGVSSLSGLALSRSSGLLVFSVMTNGIGKQYRADFVEDEIARALVDY
jgi:D-alanyl-D-alanine carboxypeptidase/D-alanyl-D-alanine-endopeptidase (penicillin-binding protein 4)